MTVCCYRLATAASASHCRRTKRQHYWRALAAVRDLFCQWLRSRSTGMRHDEMRLLDGIRSTSPMPVRVGRSKTASGAGRAVHMNARALAAVRAAWAKEFPKCKGDHFVFPSEKSALRVTMRSYRYSTRPFKGDHQLEGKLDDRPHRLWCQLPIPMISAIQPLPTEAGQPFAVVAEIMGWSPATSVRMAKRTATSATP